MQGIEVNGDFLIRNNNFFSNTNNAFVADNGVVGGTFQFYNNTISDQGISFEDFQAGDLEIAYNTVSNLGQAF